MATATSYVSKEQPSIADDPHLTNAFYDAPTVITFFASKNFLFAAEDCAVAAENMMLMAAGLVISVRGGLLLTILMVKRSYKAGTSVPTIMHSCSFCWDIPVKRITTQLQNHERKDAFCVYRIYYV